VSAARHWTDNVSWMGAVPSDWEVTRVGRITTFRDRRNDEHDGRLLSLSSYTGINLKHHDDENRLRTGEELAHYWRVKPDQLVVNPMWLNNGSIAVSRMSGVISPDYRVYDLRADVEPSFAHYVFRSPVFWSLYQVLTRGHTTYDRRISKDDFAELPFPVPPRPAQRAIADLLDRKTAAIDNLIAKKGRLLALLAEKRAALIHQAVTKGLDPNVPMKDSGVPWIGDIPAHWTLSRLGFVSNSLQTGPFGSQLGAADYVDDGIPIVNPANIGPAGLVPDWRKTVDDDTAERLCRHRLQVGDLVFARRGVLGRCGLVTPTEQGWLCGTGSLRARLDPGRVMPSFVESFIAIDGVAEWLSDQSVGSTMDNLNTSILGRLPLLVPPMDEQRTVEQRVRELRIAFKGVLGRVEAQNERLREYRQALITAAVTGQLDMSKAETSVPTPSQCDADQLGLFGGAR